jgi:hypothetical protein
LTNLITIAEYKKKKRLGSLSKLEYLILLTNIVLAYILAISFEALIVWALSTNRLDDAFVGILLLAFIFLIKSYHFVKTSKILKEGDIEKNLPYLHHYVLCILCFSVVFFVFTFFISLENTRFFPLPILFLLTVTLNMLYLPRLYKRIY